MRCRALSNSESGLTQLTKWNLSLCRCAARHTHTRWQLDGGRREPKIKAGGTLWTLTHPNKSRPAKPARLHNITHTHTHARNTAHGTHELWPHGLWARLSTGISHASTQTTPTRTSDVRGGPSTSRLHVKLYLLILHSPKTVSHPQTWDTHARLATR